MATPFQRRIKQRLAALGVSMRSASIAGGLSGDALGKYMNEERPVSPTLVTVEKLSKGLGTTPEWLAFGAGGDCQDDDQIIRVDRETLSGAINFLLASQGVPQEAAVELAKMFPRVLAAQPIDVVERDPLRSFLARWQIANERFRPRRS